MEAERKAMPGDTDILPGLHFHEKITYKVGTKVSIILYWINFLLFAQVFFCQTVYFSGT